MAKAVSGWTAEEADQLRQLLGLQPEAFARRLKIHQRTVARWRDDETNPAAALWEDLDNLLAETARTLAPWLDLDQVSMMDRREILAILAVSSGIPLAGVDVLWKGLLTEVSNTSLSSLEGISTSLAGKYHTSPPHILLGSVSGHLEKASGLLRTAAMRPIQRQRLESVVADGAIFLGVLSMHTGKLAQADACLGLAKKMAYQASNATLQAQVLAEQALLDYYGLPPETANDDPRPRIDLLEEAGALAKRHAPPIVQMAINSWMAEDKAAAKDGYGADQALEHARVALEHADLEGLTGTGFVSSFGYYRDWGLGALEGFRGVVEQTLHRPSAVNTYERSLQLTDDLRGKANQLTGLAKALITQKRPEEACDCLVEAHTIGLAHGSVVVLHHVFSARMAMPPKWNTLRCVRELDERL